MAIVTKNNVDQKLSVDLNWNSKTSMGRQKRIKRIIQRFVKDTKQEWVQGINLDNLRGEKLGYFELNLNYSLSEEAITKMSQNISLKQLAKNMASLWKKDQFEIALKILKTCGGKLNVKIQGQRISQVKKETIFPYSTACVL
jgi:hypothetical protein